MEGSSLEVADQQAGDVQRKWCFMVKLGPQFELAKRGTCVLSAPSKQALEEWLDKLTTAGSTHAKLLAQLHKSRRMGSDLRFKLSNSPSNAKMLWDAGGKEAKALQNELAKVKGELDSLHGQVLEANAKVYKSEGAAMRALALWSLLSQHLSGGDGNNDESDVLETLKLELDVTTELCHLLQSKVDFLQGYNIEKLDEDSRTGLNLTCEKALNIVLEQQAKIRVKAPRYTTEVNPEIFPENDTRFIHTSEISHLISKFKVSALKRILDLKVKAARTTGAEARTTSGLSVTKEVITRLEAVKAMAFRAGMAAVAGLQNRPDSSIQADYTTSSSASAVQIGHPGSSSRVGVPGGRSAEVSHDDTDNEDSDEEYSDGELSDG